MQVKETPIMMMNNRFDLKTFLATPSATSKSTHNVYTETPPNLVRVTDPFKSISLGASTNTSRSKSDASTLADDRYNISTLTPDWFNVTGPKTGRTSSGIPLITLNEREVSTTT